MPIVNNSSKKVGTTQSVAVINGVDISIIENGDRYVPIKPICQALGVDEDGQLRKIKADPILAPTANLRLVVAEDGKERQMVCLPLLVVFGWLFTINPKNVKEEAREVVIAYKSECYYALGNYFFEKSNYIEEKQLQIEAQMEEVDRIRKNFKDTKYKLDEANRELKEIRELSFTDWKSKKAQISIEFEGYKH